MMDSNVEFFKVFGKSEEFRWRAADLEMDKICLEPFFMTSFIFCYDDLRYHRIIMVPAFFVCISSVSHGAEETHGPSLFGFARPG